MVLAINSKNKIPFRTLNIVSTKNINMANEFVYLSSDKSKILYEEFSYGKYKPANKSGEITWRCGQCKIVTIKTKEGIVLQKTR
jgi:hypothetical protein